jgi:5-formyltetrahydrofolate cyclo-ligase
MHKVTSCVCRGCKPNGLVAGGLDLVVVPGLAFTVLGHRLGRGKGYYDTFLARYRATLGALPLTVGLAFSQQVVPSVPTDENDVCLDVLLHG